MMIVFGLSAIRSEKGRVIQKPQLEGRWGHYFTTFNIIYLKYVYVYVPSENNIKVL